jgi:hypothetical protein
MNYKTFAKPKNLLTNHIYSEKVWKHRDGRMSFYSVVECRRAIVRDNLQFFQELEKICDNLDIPNLSYFAVIGALRTLVKTFCRLELEWNPLGAAYLTNIYRILKADDNHINFFCPESVPLGIDIGFNHKESCLHLFNRIQMVLNTLNDWLNKRTGYHYFLRELRRTVLSTIENALRKRQLQINAEFKKNNE